MAAGTLVDSNVLLDIFTEDPVWLEWSVEALANAAEAGPLSINPVIYAEVSVRFSRIEDLEDALPPADFRRSALPRSSLGRRSWPTAAPTVPRALRCPTSSSAHMRPSLISRC